MSARQFVLTVYEIGYLFNEGRFVDLEGQFSDDDTVATGLALFDISLGPHNDSALAGGVGGLYTLATHDNASRREVGAGDEFHKLINGSFGVIEQEKHTVGKFAKVVR